MYDFITRYFIFTGALTGSIIFTIALVGLVVVILHEIMALTTNAINNAEDNKENDNP